jgi:hypothetical protein
MAIYAEVLTEHVVAPRYGGLLENPGTTGRRGHAQVSCFHHDRVSQRGAPRGEGQIPHDGCRPTIASVSPLRDAIVGRLFAGCQELIRRRQKDLTEALDRLPPDQL